MLWIIAGALILFWIIGAIVEQIKAPAEAEARLINLKEEKAKYEKLREEAEAAKKESNYVISKIVFHRELTEPLLKKIDKHSYYKSIYDAVLQHAFDNPPRIKNVEIRALIHSATTDKIYSTSLLDCTCQDHKRRHRPCKHMLYLAYLLGLLQINQKDSDLVVCNLSTTAVRLHDAQKELNSIKQEIAFTNKERKKLASEIDNLEKRKANIRSEVDEIINSAIAEATTIVISARREAQEIKRTASKKQ